MAGTCLRAAAALLLCFCGCRTAQGPMLTHNVFFTLADDTPQAREELVNACRTYLTHHPGVVFFAAGVRAEDMQREVNDQDFEVGLHIVFTDRAAHDAYQTAPRHEQFVAQYRGLWKKVRVFNSLAR